MSSQSSDDIMSCESYSQDSNANVVPSCSSNAPTLEFASLRIFGQGGFPRRRPQEDSDYDSDSNTANGKRKQRSQESETGVCQQKKMKNDEELECQEMNEARKIQFEKNESESENCEADNEEEEELESDEESSEECDRECEQEPEIFHMNDEPIAELPSTTSLIQPSTSGMKRRNDDELDSATVPKLHRSNSNSAENN